MFNLTGKRVVTALGSAVGPLALLGMALLSSSSANAVADANAPSLTLPAAATIPATSSRGAVVSFVAVATDDVQPTSLGCTPGSGSLLPKGANTITCVANDAAGHSTSASFVVSVVGAAEQLSLLHSAVTDLGLPSRVRIPLQVTLAAAKVAADHDRPRTACAVLDAFAYQVRAQSGKAIADGSDLLRRQAEIKAALDCVVSTAPPVLLGPGADVTAATSPGLATATVLFTGASTSVSCSPTSPATIGVGTTITTCVASNATATTTITFAVTVFDREAPVLTMPANMNVTAPAGSSSAIVTYTPNATDNAGTPTVTCIPTSGSAFASGTTLVHCTAIDTSGNTATGTFSVTVTIASASVSGRVTDRATGGPIPGITVSAYDASAPCCALSARVLIGSSQTDANGDYRITLTGTPTVKVFFHSPNLTGPLYIERWWSDGTDIGNARSILVDHAVTDIDQKLDAGYRISGRVTDASQPGVGVPNILVNVQPSPGCCFYFNITDAGGRYTSVVSAGTYRIQFYALVGSDFLAQAWNGKLPFINDDLLTVPSTTIDTNSINAALIHGFPVTGRVTDATTGAAIDRVSVVATLEDPSIRCCVSTVAGTGPDGRFTLYLPAGPHSINFQPPTPYLFEYYNDKPDRSSATIIDVTGPTANIDAALGKGFLIGGRVTDAVTGTGLASAAVTINPITGSESFTVKLTAGDGTWSASVREGTYKIGFNPPFGTDYVLQYWNGKADFLSADILVVDAVKPNIDARLAR